MILKRKNDIRATVLAALAAVSLSFLPEGASAQVPAQITVTGTEPASSCISLDKGSTDTDIIVRFVFDEQANTLTVSLVSYRNLFVFNEPVRYSKIFCCGVMKPLRLPYEVAVPPNGKFKATPEFRESIRQSSGSRRHRKYVFSRWISYDGLRPVPGEYSMVNDRIEQKFDIIGNRDSVSLSLKDIAMMDPDRREGHYRFVLDRNVNKSFDISIRRDPCFGKEKEIEASSAALTGLTAALDSLIAIYGDGIAPSEEVYDIFNGMKSVFANQYAKADTACGCAGIRENYVKYNALVDSIAALDYKMPEKPSTGASSGINTVKMLSRVRAIDTAVGKWLNSTDAIERRDLENKCESILAEASEDIKSNGVITAEQQEACKMLKKAENYYKTICKK